MSRTEGIDDPTVSVKPGENPYLIGVGRADCTGPVADVPLVSRVYILLHLH